MRIAAGDIAAIRDEIEADLVARTQLATEDISAQVTETVGQILVEHQEAQSGFMMDMAARLLSTEDKPTGSVGFGLDTRRRSSRAGPTKK